jgi:hypothetical protein
LGLLLGLEPAVIEKHALGLAADMRNGLRETDFCHLVGHSDNSADYSHVVTIGLLDAGGHEYSDNLDIMGLSAHLKKCKISHSIRR